MTKILKLVPGAPKPTPRSSRSSIAKVAVAKDRPEKPYDVRAESPQGLLLRVEPSGSRTYYVQVARGKRVRIGPAGTFTLEQAKERAKAILINPEAAVAAKKTGAAGVTLGDYITNEYEAWAKARLQNGEVSVKRARTVFASLLKRRISEITASDVDKIRTARSNAGLAPATVNRDVNCLRGIFTHWVDNTKGAAHPMAGVASLPVEDDEEIRYLTAEETERLFKVVADRDIEAAKSRASANEWRAARGKPLLPEVVGFSDHVAPMVLLTYYTGIRRGEMFKCEWRDIDMTHRTMSVRASNSKGSNTRVIPLNEEAIEVLTKIRPKVASGPVFVNPTTGKRFTDIKNSWKAITEAAELPTFTWHSLRHNFASQLVQQGVSLYSVQALLGHTTPKMTMRYARLAPNSLADAVALMPKAAAKPEPKA